MFKKYLIFTILSLLLAVNDCPAQRGFFMPLGRKSVEIPFEYKNNFIIITLVFNKTLPLKFIFDTGAEHTVITKKEFSDLLKVEYVKEFQVIGSDLTTPLIAYLARDIRLEISDKVVAPQEDILVLAEDYFRFEEFSGINVHGILSGNAFARYVFKINYEKQVITLYDRPFFYNNKPKDFVAFPMEMFRNKPYIKTRVETFPDSIAPVKLLIDTGAGLPLMLFTNTHPLLHPPSNAIMSNIGMGLGGYLSGLIGRVTALKISPLEQRNVIAYFQQIDSIVDPMAFNNRNGLVGNLFLMRFHVIFDYYGEQIWLRPGKYYQQEFEYDRSGLSLIASGAGLNTFLVQDVLAKSPASEAGFLAGDELLRVGRTPATFLSLPALQKILQGKPGKKIKIVYRRNGKKYQTMLALRDLV